MFHTLSTAVHTRSNKRNSVIIPSIVASNQRIEATGSNIEDIVNTVDIISNNIKVDSNHIVLVNAKNKLESLREMYRANVQKKEDLEIKKIECDNSITVAKNKIVDLLAKKELLDKKNTQNISEESTQNNEHDIKCLNVSTTESNQSLSVLQNTSSRIEKSIKECEDTCGSLLEYIKNLSDSLTSTETILNNSDKLKDVDITQKSDEVISSFLTLTNSLNKPSLSSEESYNIEDKLSFFKDKIQSTLDFLSSNETFLEKESTYSEYVDSLHNSMENMRSKCDDMENQLLIIINSEQLTTAKINSLIAQQKVVDDVSVVNSLSNENYSLVKIKKKKKDIEYSLSSLKVQYDNLKFSFLEHMRSISEMLGQLNRYETLSKMYIGKIESKSDVIKHLREISVFKQVPNENANVLVPLKYVSMLNSILEQFTVSNLSIPKVTGVKVYDDIGVKIVVNGITTETKDDITLRITESNVSCKQILDDKVLISGPHVRENDPKLSFLMLNRPISLTELIKKKKIVSTLSH
jgi:hypothetical protein